MTAYKTSNNKYADILLDNNKFKYAPEYIKRNREFVFKLVSNNGCLLQYAHNELKKDKEIVLAAVSNTGWALEFAHDDLKRDHEIVLAAVSSIGCALEYAHDDLKRNREIVLASVVSCVGYGALLGVHPDFKCDREIVLVAVSCEGFNLVDVPDDLKRDYEIVLAALQQNSRAVTFLSEEFTDEIKEYIPNQDLINNLREMIKDKQIIKNTTYLKQFHADTIFNFH